MFPRDKAINKESLMDQQIYKNYKIARHKNHKISMPKNRLTSEPRQNINTNQPTQLLENLGQRHIEEPKRTNQRYKLPLIENKNYLSNQIFLGNIFRQDISTLRTTMSLPETALSRDCLNA